MACDLGHRPDVVCRDCAPPDQIADYTQYLTSQSGGGTKLDSGKPRLDLIPTRPIIELGKLYGFGAEKYAAHNWRGGFDWHRTIGALLRHAFAYSGGETLDSETGLSHMAGVAFNAFALMEFEATHPELDDRYGSDMAQYNKEV